MKFKEGVSLIGLQLPMRKVFIVVDKLWQEHGEEAIITSGTDGTHSAGSLHYFGYAVDVRTRYFDSVIQTIIWKKLQSRLGATYDVVLHKTHMHIEYDPI